MSEGTSHSADAHAAHPHYTPEFYRKIWAILLVLLMISVAGPFLGIRVVTLITAFGIAIVKAYLVARNFMHLHIEKRFVAYLLGAMLVIMGLMFAGVSPDVMHHSGTNWENRSAQKVVDQGMKEQPEEHHPE